MESSYGLQIHSNTNNFVMFTSFLCQTRKSYAIENGEKRDYSTKVKTKDKQ